MKSTFEKLTVRGKNDKANFVEAPTSFTFPSRGPSGLRSERFIPSILFGTKTLNFLGLGLSSKLVLTSTHTSPLITGSFLAVKTALYLSLLLTVNVAHFSLPSESFHSILSLSTRESHFPSNFKSTTSPIPIFSRFRSSFSSKSKISHSAEILRVLELIYKSFTSSELSSPAHPKENTPIVIQKRFPHMNNCFIANRYGNISIQNHVL